MWTAGRHVLNQSFMERKVLSQSGESTLFFYIFVLEKWDRWLLENFAKELSKVRGTFKEAYKDVVRRHEEKSKK